MPRASFDALRRRADGPEGSPRVLPLRSTMSLDPSRATEGAERLNYNKPPRRGFGLNELLGANASMPSLFLLDGTPFQE